MPSAKSEKEKKKPPKKNKRKTPSNSRKRLLKRLERGIKLDSVITTGDASRLLGVSRVTIRTWIQDGLIKAKRDVAEASGRPSHTRIRLKDVGKFLKKVEVPLENLTKKRVTTSQVARAAGLSTVKIIQLADEGEITAYRMGTRRIIFLKDAIKYFKKKGWNVEALRAEAKK